MVAKNILDLLDNKPNANQFDFIKKRPTQPENVGLSSLRQKKDYGGNLDSEKAHSVE